MTRSRSSSTWQGPRTAEVLRQRKLKKQRIRLAAEKFNEKPLHVDWICFAVDLSLLSPIPFGAESTFVRQRISPCFWKVKRRWESFWAGNIPSTLKCIGSMWTPSPSHPPLRCGDAATILGQFRLPGEAQCIDTQLDALSGRLFLLLRNLYHEIKTKEIKVGWWLSVLCMQAMEGWGNVSPWLSVGHRAAMIHS